MNLFKLSISYLRKRALNTTLNILLLSFGIATVVVLLLFSHQLEDNLYKNAEGVDAVVGAKGSPIQLILSGIFHIDSPTGNVPLSEATQIVRHPMVSSAIPLALGDNYNGHRIVGTTYDYPEQYNAQLNAGNWWELEFEVVLGAEVARLEGLNIGDEIFSSHGFSEDGHTHEERALPVTGIMEPTGTALDRLILTSVETMWGIHDVHDHDDEDHDHEHDDHEDHDGHEHEHDEDGHEHHDHDHEHDEHDHDHEEHESHDDHDHDHDHHHHHGSARQITSDSYLAEANSEEDITALLVKYANPLAAAQFPRYVNEQTSMQAAAPAVEITRLLQLLGFGLDAIKVFAYVLILASVLGIFIALLNSMKDRKYDLAIMRSLGASRWKLFMHVIIEGVIIAAAGGILGMLFGHLAVELTSSYFTQAQQLYMSGFMFVPGEFNILLLAVGIGIVASVIPAYRAYKTDIAHTLSKS